MSAIVFDCTKGCGAVLRADLGAGQDFGPLRTDGEAREHGRRRREYIGQQVENALLAHLIFDCPIENAARDACVICATPVDDGDEVCGTCKNISAALSLQPGEGGQQ